MDIILLKKEIFAKSVLSMDWNFSLYLIYIKEGEYMRKDVKYDSQEEKLIIKGYEREESYGEKLENEMRNKEINNNEGINNVVGESFYISSNEAEILLKGLLVLIPSFLKKENDMRKELLRKLWNNIDDYSKHNMLVNEAIREHLDAWEFKYNEDLKRLDINI